MRCVLAPLAVVLALVLSGCAGGGGGNKDSSKDFQGDQQQVAKTVEDLQSAAKDRNGTKICADLIVAELRDKISSTDCPATMKRSIKDTDEVDLIVKSVTVNGTTATAVVREKLSNDKSRIVTLQFEKTAGRWRISQLPA